MEAEEAIREALKDFWARPGPTTILGAGTRRLEGAMAEGEMPGEGPRGPFQRVLFGPLSSLCLARSLLFPVRLTFCRERGNQLSQVAPGDGRGWLFLSSFILFF